MLPKIISIFLWHWYLHFPLGKPPLSNFHVSFEIKLISYTGHKNATCGPDYLCHLIPSFLPSYSFEMGSCPKAGSSEPRRLRTSVWVLRKTDSPNCLTGMRCHKCGASLIFCADWEQNQFWRSRVKRQIQLTLFEPWIKLYLGKN